ncbi:hypothetical protein BVI434_3770007 [Burkholderia vietnamiensis]|nr:hypothetical protein BVI434_3770007 [Burkholderia vietnamiensis]
MLLGRSAAGLLACGPAYTADPASPARRGPRPLIADGMAQPGAPPPAPTAGARPAAVG